MLVLLDTWDGTQTAPETCGTFIALQSGFFQHRRLLSAFAFLLLAHMSFPACGMLLGRGGHVSNFQPYGKVRDRERLTQHITPNQPIDIGGEPGAASAGTLRHSAHTSLGATLLFLIIIIRAASARLQSSRWETAVNQPVSGRLSVSQTLINLCKYAGRRPGAVRSGDVQRDRLS